MAPTLLLPLLLVGLLGLPLLEAAVHSQFGIITDLHYAQRDPVTTKFYSSSLEKARASIDHLNELSLEFLVCDGDLKDLNPDDEDIQNKTLEYLRLIEAELTRFKGRTYHVIGNHDIDAITKAQFLERVQNSGIPSDQGRYYSFDASGIHYVVLDANFYKDGRDHANTSFDPEYKWYEPFIPESELEWLENDLKNATGKNTIVFVHQRVDASEPAPSQLTVINAPEVRKIFETHGDVLAVFHGHDHAAVASPSITNGIIYYTLKAVVEGPFPENNAYAAVSIHDDCTLEILGFGNAVTSKFSPQPQITCYL